MAIKAVIFDFGGVLVRMSDRGERHRWEERLGLPAGELSRLVFASPAARRLTLGQGSEADVWQHVADTCGLDGRQLGELRQDFWAGEETDPELVQFLGELRPRYTTAILSNAWPSAREAFVGRYGLGGVIDAIIISGEEGLAKPDRRIYDIAAERLEIRPEEAVFVDDTPENVRAAEEAGMWGVHFVDTAQAIAAVRKHLDKHR